MSSLGRDWRNDPEALRMFTFYAHGEERRRLEQEMERQRSFSAWALDEILYGKQEVEAKLAAARKSNQELQATVSSLQSSQVDMLSEQRRRQQVLEDLEETLARLVNQQLRGGGS